MIYVLRKAEQRAKLPGMEPEDQEAKQAIEHLGKQGVKAELVRGSGGKLLRVPLRDAKRLGVTPVSYGGGKAVVAVEDVAQGKLHKAGPYIGPRGGKWSDPQHKIPWKEEKARKKPGAVDTSLWKVRPAMGYAGGPDKVWLTEAGEMKAAQVATGLHPKVVAALEDMAALGGEVDIEGHRGATPYQQKHGLALNSLTAKGYAELIPWEERQSLERRYRLTEKGKQAIQDIQSERQRLVQRIEQSRLPEVEATLVEETPEVEAEMVGRAPRARKKPEQMSLLGRPTQGEIPGLGKSSHLRKGGPYIGSRGGKWADPQHTIPYAERGGEQSIPPAMVKQALDWAKSKGVHVEVEAGSQGALLRVSGGGAANLGVKPVRYSQGKAIVRAVDVARQMAKKKHKGPQQAGLFEQEEREQRPQMLLDLGETKPQPKREQGKLELAKAEARGGTYHRRVPKPGGGYRYFYDEAKYKQSKGAHLDGDGAARDRIRAHVGKQIEAGGKCPVESLKSLVRRYGAQKVGEVVKAAGYEFKKGHLHPKLLEKEGTFSNKGQQSKGD